MRTQFLYLGLLSMSLAGGLASAGCDDNHTGQPGDPGGPVKLVRIMVQDSEQPGPVGSATDLLDTAGSPLSTAVACDTDLNPCIPQFTLGGTTVSFTCVPTAMGAMTGPGTCPDPLQPGKVQTLSVPSSWPQNAGAEGGLQIRLVFNKLLNNGIEDLKVDPTQPPGSNLTFALKSGITELDASDGTEVSSAKYWDNSGSYTGTSDPVNIPFGPAIVIKPHNPLATSTTYQIVIHTGMVQDRKGNGMADQVGNPLTGDFKLKFTTEPLNVLSVAPNIAASTPVALATDDVLQFLFNTSVNDATPNPPKGMPSLITVVDANNANVPVLVYHDQGSSGACAVNPTSLDVVPVDTTGMPTAWAAGSYTVNLTAYSDQSGDQFPMQAFPFTVDGTKKKGGATSVGNHPPVCM
jgi:hypothetical protein